MDEPDYMKVLGKIYRKDAVVLYSESIILDDFGDNVIDREEIIESLPESKTLLPIPSMTDTEMSIALDSLATLGLIEEVDGIPFRPTRHTRLPPSMFLDRIEYVMHADQIADQLNYVKLTEKGFDVAHERAVRQRQQEILESQNATSERIADLTEQQSESSHLLAVVTVLLGATALIQATAAVFFSFLASKRSTRWVICYDSVILVVQS